MGFGWTGMAAFFLSAIVWGLCVVGTVLAYRKRRWLAFVAGLITLVPTTYIFGLMLYLAYWTYAIIHWGGGQGWG